MSIQYYKFVLDVIGRPETTQTTPNTAVFARPDSEISQSTVTTTVDNTATSSQSGGIYEKQYPLGEIK